MKSTNSISNIRIRKRYITLFKFRYFFHKQSGSAIFILIDFNSPVHLQCNCWCQPLTVFRIVRLETIFVEFEQRNLFQSFNYRLRTMPWIELLSGSRRKWEQKSNKQSCINSSWSCLDHHDLPRSSLLLYWASPGGQIIGAFWPACILVYIVQVW